MRVWVNTLDEGWVQHGKDRSSNARAASVADLLRSRLGWHTAAGEAPPSDVEPGADAPSAAVARVSPAPLAEGLASRYVPTGPPAPGKEEESEPYADQIVAFALENQLRDFLITNLSLIRIEGKQLKLFRDVAGRIGREFSTPIGRIDILAVDEGGGLYVFELKLDRGVDSVVGQVARYMTWVRTELANGKNVRGVLVARSFDEKVRYAAAAVPDVMLFEYEMDFKLKPLMAVGSSVASVELNPSLME